MALHKLMVNYIPESINQDDFNAIFSRIGPLASCKLVKDHQTGKSLCYGFVEYADKNHADQAIDQINGIQLDSKTLKVVYAKPQEEVRDIGNLYVAGFPPSVKEAELEEVFARYGNVLMSKILYNKEDQTSRGAGFVRFQTKTEAEDAITALDRTNWPGSDVPLTVRMALPGKGASTKNASLRYNPMASAVNSNLGLQSSILPGAAGGAPIPIHVYGLQPHHDELTLYELFAPFGGVQNVKLMRDPHKDGNPSKGFGFVNYVKYEEASQAIMVMNQKQHEGKTLQVSFKTDKGGAGSINNGVNAGQGPAGQPAQLALALQANAALQQQNQLILAALQQPGAGGGASSILGLSGGLPGGLSGGLSNGLSGGLSSGLSGLTQVQTPYSYAQLPYGSNGYL